jgi:hypothetical protein
MSEVLSDSVSELSSVSLSNFVCYGHVRPNGIVAPATTAAGRGRERRSKTGDLPSPKVGEGERKAAQKAADLKKLQV